MQSTDHIEEGGPVRPDVGVHWVEVLALGAAETFRGLEMKDLALVRDLCIKGDPT